MTSPETETDLAKNIPQPLFELPQKFPQRRWLRLSGILLLIAGGTVIAWRLITSQPPSSQALKLHLL